MEFFQTRTKHIRLLSILGPQFPEAEEKGELPCFPSSCKLESARLPINRGHLSRHRTNHRGENPLISQRANNTSISPRYTCAQTSYEANFQRKILFDNSAVKSIPVEFIQSSCHNDDDDNRILIASSRDSESREIESNRNWVELMESRDNERVGTRGYRITYAVLLSLQRHAYR